MITWLSAIGTGRLGRCLGDDRRRDAALPVDQRAVALESKAVQNLALNAPQNANAKVTTQRSELSAVQRMLKSAADTTEKTPHKLTPALIKSVRELLRKERSVDSLFEVSRFINAASIALDEVSETDVYDQIFEGLTELMNEYHAAE